MVRSDVHLERAVPFAHNGDFATWYEIDGSGPPLVMYHGLTGTGNRWRDTGYADGLRDRFTLLLLDARGHGRSSKPHDPALSTRHQRAADVIAVLDAEHIDRALYWGHSLGGMVGFTVGHDYQERMACLVLTGFNPAPMPPAERAEVASWIDGLQGGMESFVAGYEAAHGTLLDAETRAKWLANDHLALIASIEAWSAGNDGSQQHELPAIAAPTMVLVGTEEPFFESVQTACTTMPDATFVPLDGFDHLQTFARSDAVLPHAIPFLERAWSGRPDQ
ncbi:MAG: alpha/beta fold hydrolase [Thermomicrobiales bacterium]